MLVELIGVIYSLCILRRLTVINMKQYTLIQSSSSSGNLQLGCLCSYKAHCHLKGLQRTETDVKCDSDQNGLTMTYVKAGYYILVCMAADTGLYLDM